MIGQSIIGAAEIEPFVFYARPEIPVSRNVKPMSVAEIVINRIAVAEYSTIVLKIAPAGVNRLVGKKLGRVFVLVLAWRWTRLKLEPCSGKHRREDTDETEG